MLKTTKSTVSQRLVSVTVFVCMVTLGVALGASISAHTWNETDADQTPTVAPVSDKPDVPQSANRTHSMMSLSFTRDGDHVQVRANGDKLDIKVNGEPIGEDRLKKNGDGWRVLDQAGETIVTLRRMPDGGWSMGAGAMPMMLQGFGAQPNPAAQRPRLGVTLGTIDKDTARHLHVNDPESASLVREVTKDSAAERAGLKVGDVIIAIDTNAHAAPANLIDAIAAKYPGDEVTLRVIRDSEAIDVKATLGGVNRKGAQRGASRHMLDMLRGFGGVEGIGDAPGFFHIPDMGDLPRGLIDLMDIGDFDRLIREMERLQERMRRSFDARDNHPTPRNPRPDTIDQAPQHQLRGEQINDLAKRMRTLSHRLTDTLRVAATGTFVESATRAFSSAFDNAVNVDETVRKQLLQAFDQAVRLYLEDGRWSYSKHLGSVSLGDNADAIREKLSGVFTQALNELKVTLPTTAVRIGHSALHAAAGALASATTKLSDDAKARVDAILNQMSDMQNRFHNDNTRTILPIEQGAKKVSA